VNILEQQNEKSPVNQVSEIQKEPDEENQRENQLHYQKVPARGMDVLNLPPRSEVHQSAEKRFRLKVRRPFVRFMIIIFLLVILSLAAFFLQKSGVVDIISVLTNRSR
jgi:hypothetical protein